MTKIADLVNTHQALRTLNVKEDCTFEEIKIAYRKLALEFHPDKNTTEQEGIQFKKITEAYQIIKKHYQEGKRIEPRKPRITSYNVCYTKLLR